MTAPYHFCSLTPRDGTFGSPGCRCCALVTPSWQIAGQTLLVTQQVAARAMQAADAYRQPEEAIPGVNRKLSKVHTCSCF